MGNLSASAKTLFLTLVAANDAPFSASFRPSSRGIFTQNLDNPLMRLARKRGAVSETRGFPAIYLKFRKITVNLSPSVETLFRSLIVAKDSPFSASFRPSSRRPDFYPEFGQSSAAISSRKRGHFGDTWIAHDFPKLLDDIGQFRTIKTI